MTANTMVVAATTPSKPAAASPPPEMYWVVTAASFASRVVVALPRTVLASDRKYELTTTPVIPTRSPAPPPVTATHGNGFREAWPGAVPASGSGRGRGVSSGDGSMACRGDSLGPDGGAVATNATIVARQVAPSHDDPSGQEITEATQAPALKAVFGGHSIVGVHDVPVQLIPTGHDTT